MTTQQTVYQEDFSKQRYQTPEEISNSQLQQTDSRNIWKDPYTREIVDMTTGIVLGYETERGPEWRAFDDEQRAKRKRVGLPINLTIHDKGLTTMIGLENNDIYGVNIFKGKELEPGQKTQILRLRKWQRRMKVQTSQEHNLAFALPEINKICDSLNLPKKATENACAIYRKTVNGGFGPGKTIKDILIAAIYTSYRQLQIHRLGFLDELSEVSEIDKKTIKRNYRFLIKNGEKRIKDIKTKDDKKKWRKIPPENPNIYVSKLRDKLNFPKYTEDLALEISEKAKENRISWGKAATGLAAAATYIALLLTEDRKDRKSQREIAEAANLTEMTVRNRYKELMGDRKYTKLKGLMFEIKL
jgi:transcription initiation factor TFIIB